MEDRPTEGVLSRTPSVLVRAAHRALQQCTKDSRYRFTLARWHRGSAETGKQAEICVAGALIAQVLGVDSAETTCPAWLRGEKRIPVADEEALVAVELFRSGLLHLGVRQLGIEPPAGLAERVAMREDVGSILEGLVAVAAQLERAGL